MTGKVLLARQSDWRARTRLATAAASPPAWKRRETVEFDEPDPDHAGGDAGWTVGYLDVLLLLVTLFAALLGATYLQLNQLHSARAAESEPLAVFAPAVEAKPAAAPNPEVASTEARATPEAVSGPTAEVVSVEPPADGKPSLVAIDEAPAQKVLSEDPPASRLLATEIASSTLPADPLPSMLTDAMPEPAVPPEFRALMELVAAHGERQDLELLLDRHQLRLEVGDGILFASGTADLGSGGQTLIEELVTALDDDRLKISVEGHTDDIPINTARFPSNWELSSIRATTVARELIAHGIPQHRIRVTGFADTRPRAPNDSPANRALNRRVSLVLEVTDEVIAVFY